MDQDQDRDRDRRFAPPGTGTVRLGPGRHTVVAALVGPLRERTLGNYLEDSEFEVRVAPPPEALDGQSLTTSRRSA